MKGFLPPGCALILPQDRIKISLYRYLGPALRPDLIGKWPTRCPPRPICRSRPSTWRSRLPAEATRLRILALLGEAELTVSDLTAILRQSQPRISRHLRLLAEAGLVERFREGSWAFFRLAERSATAELARELIALPRSRRSHRRARSRAAGCGAGPPHCGGAGLFPPPCSPNGTASAGSMSPTRR